LFYFLLQRYTKKTRRTKKYHIIKKKVSENLEETRKSCNFAPAFRRNRWHGLTSGSTMLRWNDKQYLIIKQNGFN